MNGSNLEGVNQVVNKSNEFWKSVMRHVQDRLIWKQHAETLFYNGYYGCLMTSTTMVMLINQIGGIQSANVLVLHVPQRKI